MRLKKLRQGSWHIRLKGSEEQVFGFSKCAVLLLLTTLKYLTQFYEEVSIDLYFRLLTVFFLV